jgi:GNAT superfamily N-acetyltransferase
VTTLEGYTVRSHAAVGELATQVYDLAHLAFGSYAGVLRPSAAHRAWYVRRPGMDAGLSLAALQRDHLVASVFVTVVSMRLGGRLQPVGVVDTVMTHPAHRGRGLARRLLGEAIAGMRARGLAASLLYTVADSMPYRFYQTLGYRPHAPVRYLRRVHPATAAPALAAYRAGPADQAQIVAFLNVHFSGHDGYVPIDDGLWRWRRVERPGALPAETYCVARNGRLLGCLTLCRAPIVGAGPASYVLTDLALALKVDAQSALEALLGAVPGGAEVLTLSPRCHDEANRVLSAAGFVETGTEVAMVLPLDRQAEGDLTRPPQRWYVLVESVIGV